jgi:hypothetical protein
VDGAGGPQRWARSKPDWSPGRAGSYVLMARATDEAGETQPLIQDWNPSGYLWNVVPQVRVEIGSAAAPPRSEMPAAPPVLSAQVQNTCIGCHGEDMIAGQKLTRTQWEREVDKMTRWGAAVKPEERESIIDFLLSHFGPTH